MWRSNTCCCHYSSVVCLPPEAGMINTRNISKLHDFQSLEAEVLISQHVGLSLVLGEGPSPQALWADPVEIGQHAQMITGEYWSSWSSWRCTDAACHPTQVHKSQSVGVSVREERQELEWKLKALAAKSLDLSSQYTDYLLAVQVLQTAFPWPQLTDFLVCKV